MKIDFIEDQGKRKEDFYLIKKPLFAVFDGANSTNRFYKPDEITGGQLAASIARDVFAKNNNSLEVLAKEANQEIRKRQIAEGVDMRDKLNLWITAFAAIRLHKNYFEWLNISDCQIIVVFQDNSFKALVSDYDHDAEVLLEWKKLAKKKIKNIRELIDAAGLKRIRREINVSWGALTGEDQSVKFLNSGRVSLENLKHIIICTDGLFIPKEDPKKEDDFDTLVKLFLEGGLKKVKNYVRSLEKNDPYCWKYPRYKQHDDIVAISLTF